MTSYRAVIADDEPLLRHHLQQSLAEVWPQLAIVAAAGDGESALQAIEAHQPDVVFLDIRMPMLDGISLAHRVNQQAKPSLIVFVTAFDHYAIKAFEENAVDYLLKPISEARLSATCEKIQRRLAERQPAPSLPQMAQLLADLTQRQQPASIKYLQWIRASRGEDIHLLSVDDVHYFKADEKYVSVYVEQSHNKVEEFLIRTSLRELVQQLDPDHFWQIHRSTVVQVGKIHKVNKDFSGRMFVHLSSGKLSVSRAQQSLFKGM